ncbi:MAG: hypothetical protein QOI64_2805 [Solirubrobacteraceae bacterium]|nr:hypothetical protein [Solirubrobacteraceae bacterium]
MILSLLMYALMVATFVAVVGTLVSDAVRSRSRAGAPVRVAAHLPRDARRPVRRRGECVQATGALNGAGRPAHSPARPRRR